MNDLAKRWGDDFHGQRLYIAWSGLVVARAIWSVFKPESAIDVGCSVGAIPAGLRAYGVNGYGLEGTASGCQFFVLPLEKYIWHDLREPLVGARRFDIAICFEVLSVIDADHHATVIDNLAALSDTILVGNVDDIAGYDYDEQKTLAFKYEIEHWRDKMAMKAMYRSAKVFVRNGDKDA